MAQPEEQSLNEALFEPAISQNLLIDSSDPSDFDSSYGSDIGSATTSLNSSVTDFRYLHGRRFHAFRENAYWLPNDEIEIERLDIQHHAWRYTLNGRLHLSPLTEIHDVVDLGTGSGQWAVEFADEHPTAQVMGTDLSPIQPQLTPPNCSWLIDDVEEDWLFNKKFDFVHSRMLMMGVKDWPRYFRQSWDNLKPGGWMEVQEVQFPIAYANGDVKPDSPLLVWSRLVAEAAGRSGIDTMVTTKFEDQIRAQGFINTRIDWPKWALGHWPKGEREKIIGMLTLDNTRQFISGIALSLFTRVLGWSSEAVETFLIDVRKDLENKKNHYYWQMCICCAQKPPLQGNSNEDGENPV